MLKGEQMLPTWYNPELYIQTPAFITLPLLYV